MLDQKSVYKAIMRNDRQNHSVALVYQVPRKFSLIVYEKLTNYKPCSRILRNELVILRITGLLLFTDHAEKFFRSRFTASENGRSLFTENKLSELIIFFVVFDCESGVRRSNLILLYFWRGFGVSQFVLFFISQD